MGKYRGVERVGIWISLVASSVIRNKLWKLLSLSPRSGTESPASECPTRQIPARKQCSGKAVRVSGLLSHAGLKLLFRSASSCVTTESFAY